ncbi:hypothetical protein [Micromonospora sp. WMMD1274]|uniref:hypothetical protein n=1 Tax=Micromonospora sp. WMMD1274 TaxID=3404116 RepID=UPI003B95AA06
MQDQTVPQTTATEPATPDYWVTMAADLRAAADHIASLAGTPMPHGFLPPHLSIAYAFDEHKAEKTVPVIDAIAAAFGFTAETKTEGRGRAREQTRHASGRVGRLSVNAKANMPVPPTRAQTRAELEAKVAELEAQLAQGGGTR